MERQRARVAGAGGIANEQKRENSGATGKEINFSYVDDFELSLDNYFSILEEVIDVSPKWKGFGGALRLIPTSLNNIEANNNSDPNECLRSVIVEYLRKNYDYKTHGLPSWRKIAEAISHRSGGNDDDVALQIAQKHSRFSSLYTKTAVQREVSTATSEIAARPLTQQVNASTSSRTEKKDIKPVCKERFSLVTYTYDIVDATSLDLLSGEPRTFYWEGFGLKLEVPANAVDSRVPYQYLGLHTCSTNQFKIPENMELLSGVYWLEFNGKLANPITIEIEHCASLEHPSQFSSLSFIATEATGPGTPPIELHHCPGGVFPHRKCYGSIELSQSSLVAVVGTSSATKSYRLLNYYIPKTVTTWNMDLIIIYNLEISIKSVDKYYSKNGLHLTQLKVSFTGEEMSLDIPESGLPLESGWRIEGLKCRFQRNKVNYFHPTSVKLPSCRLKLQWMGQELSPPSFAYTLKITGFNVTRIAIGIPPPKDMRCGASKFATLAKVERRMLERRLDEDSNVLSNKYCLLLTKTQTYTQRNCTHQNLMVCIMSMKYVRNAFKRSPLNELETAESADDIIYILVKRDLLSFLHFDFIKKIIKSCCKKSAKLNDLLQKYKEAFNNYIKRQVCETSYYYDGKINVFTETISKEAVDLLIIMDDSWDDFTPFSKVLNLEKVIAKTFRCSRVLLDLQSIEPHCLQLRYALDRSLVNLIFPLTLEEWNELRSQGIAQIHCGDYQYMMDEKAEAKVFGDILNHEQQYSSKDYFVSFGKCLGKEEAKLCKVWNEVLGRYDTAMLKLVMDVLQESETPEEKLSNALSEMRTPESASRASEAIQKAVLSGECLAILLKDTPKQLALGRELGMENALLEALQSHFEDNPQLLVNHMMGIWLMEGPKDPIKRLSEAFTAVGDRETATKLQLLCHLDAPLKADRLLDVPSFPSADN